MIFKSLFTNKNNKKWQSEKISERVQAIAKLDPSQLPHKKILHELAYNDGSATVRWPALEKLQEFSLYWQSYKQDPEPAIRKKSESKLAHFIFDSNDLPESDKLAFVTQSAPPSLLEKWIDKVIDDARQESREHLETIVLKMLERIGKDQITAKILKNTTVSDETTKTLIAQLTDIKVLKKLAKLQQPFFSLVGSQAASLRLTELNEKAERPAQLEQHITLLLAKLKALKEETRFEVFQKSLHAFEQEWSALQSEFELLNAAKLQDIQEKYSTLLNVAQTHFHLLEAKYKEELDLQTAAEHKLEQLKKLTHQFESIRDELSKRTSAIAETLDSDISATFNQFNIAKEYGEIVFSELLNALNSEIAEEANSINDKKLIELVQKAQRLKSEWMEFVDHSASLLEVRENIETLKTTEQHSQAWNDALSSLSGDNHTLLNNPFGKKALGQLVPEDFELWQQSAQQLQKQHTKAQNEISRNIAKRLKDVQKQIQQGRYNDAIFRFDKLQESYDQLDPDAQQKIQVAWDNAQHKINELRELRATINTPKIDELMHAARKLAEQPLENLDEQAYRIKTIRKNWNSLRLEESTYQEQQAQLDTLLERAFEPCRAVFQEREQQRTDNFAQKQNVIKQLKQCFVEMKNNNVADWKQLESVFAKLQSDWNAIGQVDRDKQVQQKDEFFAICKDIRGLISAEHIANKEAKQALLDQAKEIVSGNTSSDKGQQTDAAQALKTLQSKWKSIGFAGKADRALWKAFRQENDRFFDQRNEQYNARKTASSESLKTLTEFLEQQRVQISATTKFVELKKIEDKLKEITCDREVLLPTDLKKVTALKAEVEQELQNGFLTVRQLESQQKTTALFEKVEAMTNGEQPNFDELNSHWRNALQTASTAVADAQQEDDQQTTYQSWQKSRAELTLLIESVCQVPSPSELKEQRNAVNLFVLTQKMENGIEFKKDMLLTKWLAAEPWTSEQKVYVERVKPIFV